jgi:hypothetical protein
MNGTFATRSGVVAIKGLGDTASYPNRVSVPPEVLEARRRQLGVPDGVLD